jgi:hypothetical protein
MPPLPSVQLSYSSAVHATDTVLPSRTCTGKPSKHATLQRPSTEQTPTVLCTRLIDGSGTHVTGALLPMQHHFITHCKPDSSLLPPPERHPTILSVCQLADVNCCILSVMSARCNISQHRQWRAHSPNRCARLIIPKHQWQPPWT